MDTSSQDPLEGDAYLLLTKVGRTAVEATSPEDFYERARKWWTASPEQVRLVSRVLAVKANKIVQVFDPVDWEVSHDPETEGKVAFLGGVAKDAARWLGLDVSAFFQPGATNPIRYTTVALLDKGDASVYVSPKPRSANLKSAVTTVTRPTCPTCHMELSLLGLCDVCT